MRSQLIFKAEDPYERCGYQGNSSPCDHPRANHRTTSGGQEFCLECRDTRPGAISSDVVHGFESKRGVTGSTGPAIHHRNPVPLSRVNRVAHPNASEIHMHHENLLTGLEEMRSRFYGTARDKTEKSQRVWKSRTPDIYSLTSKKGRTITHIAAPSNMSSVIYGKTEHRGYSGASAGRMLRLRDRSSGIRGKIRQRFGAPKLSE